ncbi:initiation factor 4A-like protein [Wolffia australiana]
MANEGLGELLGQFPQSSASQSPISSFDPGRHFYLAVDRHQFKMETLVDLLGVVGRSPRLPIVICCSSRDDLDSVCATLSSVSHISLSYLYSDQSDAERASILNKFRKTTAQWNSDGAEGQLQSHLLVVTDASLPMISSAETQLQARILINFEVPTKETYARRMSTFLAAGGIAISMVVGGEVVALKALEEGIGFSIKDMPIHISEIL